MYKSSLSIDQVAVDPHVGHHCLSDWECRNHPGRWVGATGRVTLRG